MSERERLLGCPFCGGNDLTLTVDRHGWKIVECGECGARGPCIDLEGDEYLNRWNTRASTPSFNEAIELAAKCVPTNWCDELLTGPNAPRGPLECPAVEKLLLAIINRIRALSTPDTTTMAGGVG